METYQVLTPFVCLHKCCLTCRPCTPGKGQPLKAGHLNYTFNNKKSMIYAGFFFLEFLVDFYLKKQSMVVKVKYLNSTPLNLYPTIE